MRTRQALKTSRWIGILLLSAALVLQVGCDDDKLGEAERQEIGRILRTGSSFPDDPFVRAETLRVLESLAEPRFDELAISALEDEEPMVGVAALRALLATKHADCKRYSVRRWNMANEAERATIFEAIKDAKDDALLLEIAEKAIRAKDDQLRLEAFELLEIRPIDQAKASNLDDELRRTLLPKLGTYVNKKDEILAARALQKLIEFEGEARSQPFLTTLGDEAAADQDRIYAAKLLRLAAVQSATPLFEALITKADQPISTKIGLPSKPMNERLVRAAILGKAALGGDDEIIHRAQQYLTGATPGDTLEILRALAQNPSPESTISLKIAMQDSRQEIRLEAIKMYAQRKDAQAQALLSALNQSDYAAKRHIARALIARFPEEWSQDLKFQLQSEDRVDQTLKLLREVIIHDDDAVVLKPVVEQLLARSKETAKDPKDSASGQRAALAAYLLLRVEPQNETYLKLLEQQSEVHTRYVLLEHLMRHRPAQSAAFFKRYLYDDLYALRLMSAAGLWRAFNVQPAKGQLAAKAPEAKTEAKAEREDTPGG